jgi:hypothetical protein
MQSKRLELRYGDAETSHVDFSVKESALRMSGDNIGKGHRVERWGDAKCRP